MKRYILFACAFALGWFCLESGQAVKDYTDSDTVSDIPLAGRCAHDGYTIDFITNKKIYEYKNTKDPEKCKLFCEQWAFCDVWVFHADKTCTLIPGQAFQVQELTKLRISGYNECPRSDRCIINDQFYHGKPNMQQLTNVKDPFECQTKCEDKKGCTHFTWSMKQGTEDYCWLFNGDFGEVARGALEQNNNFPKFYVSGAAECNACFNFHLETKHLKRIVFPGGAASVLADSHWKCQEKCNADPLCRWFEWWTNDRKCLKFNPFTNLEVKNNYVTGFRECDLACGKCDVLGLLDSSDTTCDNAGNCRCKANYIDKLCTQCAAGYTRARDGTCTKNG